MIEELSITSILRRQQSCSFLNAALRAALVMDEEERKEHEVGDWKGDPRYHIDRFSHSDRMRWLFLSYLSCTSIGSRVCAGIWATIGTSNDLVRSRSTTSWRSTLSLLFTLRQGLRRRKLIFSLAAAHLRKQRSILLQRFFSFLSLLFLVSFLVLFLLLFF